MSITRCIKTLKKKGIEVNAGDAQAANTLFDTYSKENQYFFFRPVIGFLGIAREYLRYQDDPEKLDLYKQQLSSEILERAKENGITEVEGEALTGGVVEGHIQEMFEELTRQNQKHIGGVAIVMDLAEEVMRRKGCPLDGTMPHLQEIANRALYDERIDFSSREKFVGTVTSRLDDYLA